MSRTKPTEVNKLSMLESHKLFDHLITNKEKYEPLPNRIIASLAEEALGFEITEAHVFVRRAGAGIGRVNYVKKPKTDNDLNVSGAFMRLLATLEETGFINREQSQHVYDVLTGKRGA